MDKVTGLIERLYTSNPATMQAQILEDLVYKIKMNNSSGRLQQAFTPYDQQQRGTVAVA